MLFFGHHLAHASRAHKRHQVGLAREGGAGAPVAGDELDEVCWRTRSREARRDEPAVEAGRPERMLAHLDDDGVSGEDGCGDGVEDIMEGVVPRDDGAEDSPRMPLDTRSLVEAHAAR